MSENQQTIRSAFPNIAEADRPYTKVAYGTSFSIACVNHIISVLKTKRAYIFASNSLSKQTGFLKQLEKALEDNEVYGGTWIGIKPHTPLDSLFDVMEDMRNKKADCLITLGGGSLTDGAKIITFALANNINSLTDLDPLRIKDINAVSSNTPSMMPMIFIPTSLSGGEYSKYGGGTDPRNHEKKIFTDEHMYASLVILDPALTISTPMWVWLSTGVRAIDHCVEAICSSAPKKESDEASEEGLKLLIPSLLTTKKDPSNLEARLNAQLGCTLSLTPLNIHVPKGASHGIGHQLGPLGVGHGQTSCILMPAVMKYNASVNAAQQERVKKVLWGQESVKNVLEEAGQSFEGSDLGDNLDAVFRALGMPRSLKEVGIGKDKLEVLAENSVKDVFCTTNPRPLLKPEQVMEVLKMVVGE